MHVLRPTVSGISHRLEEDAVGSAPIAIRVARVRSLVDPLAGHLRFGQCVEMTRMDAPR